MKSALYISTALLSALSSAAPTKRALSSDADILNYALTLEHLEDTFYREGLANFTEADFTAAGFDVEVYARIQTVASDEATHVKFITDALSAAGGSPVAACTYDFGVTDVKSFLATAAILEGVGVSAYIGAAADIMSKTYLTAAGSILSVEARHASYIRNAVGNAPFPQPFDNPLGYNEVHTLASQFFVSCPSTNLPLPVKPFPILAAQPTAAGINDPITTGSNLFVSTPGNEIEIPTGGSIYAAFITVLGPVFAETTVVEGGFVVVVPEGIAGQSYLVLTGCDTAATDDTIVAGPAIVEISS